MRAKIYKLGICLAEYHVNENGQYVLKVNRKVRVSSHKNNFKNRDAMFGYLDWLFDSDYQVRSE